jgi:hypothetical protein
MWFMNQSANPSRKTDPVDQGGLSEDELHSAAELIKLEA